MSRCFVIVGLITLTVGIGGAAYGVWTIWDQHRFITSARQVPAKVIEHRKKELKASGFVSQVPLVKYEYLVDQQKYTSETVTPAELMLPDTWAESAFQQFPIGARTEAYYDPQDPGKAFLLPKYSVHAYLPLLVSLVIAALGLGVVVDQLADREVPSMTPTRSGAMVLGARQHHLTRARVLGFVGTLGLVGGAPAIMHHLSVSTSPHERMGFVLEAAYGIAVLVVLARSGLQFRRGAGFGAPVVTVNRSPALGQTLQCNISLPTRFNGIVDVKALLKCEEKDVSVFSLSEETPERVLFSQEFLLAQSRPVTRGGEITETVTLSFPDDVPATTPVDSLEKTHVVWIWIVAAEGSGGRAAKTEFILLVTKA